MLREELTSDDGVVEDKLFLGVVCDKVTIMRDAKKTIRDCSFSLQKGQLCIITGAVGSGKVPKVD